MDMQAIEGPEDAKHQAGDDCLVGRRIRAVYYPQTVPHFRGNPLTEVFEDSVTLQSIGTTLRTRPVVTPAIHQAPVTLRTAMLRADLQHLFEPLKSHLELAERIQMMSRLALLSRNPFAKLPIVLSEPENSLLLIGASGMGKSRTTKEILRRLLPQVIDHSDFHGRRFHFAQIVWVYLNAPAMGTPRQLCVEFIRAVDRALDRDYDGNRLGDSGKGYEYHYDRSGRASIDSLMSSIATIIRNHGVALLVLDEVAHLKSLKEGEAQRHFNFLFSLLDRLGVAVLLISNYDGLPILQGQSRIISRASGQGTWIWDRMVKDQRPWQHVLKALFPYQYVRHRVTYEHELRPAIAAALYYETQGVFRYLKALWVFAHTSPWKRALSS